MKLIHEKMSQLRPIPINYLAIEDDKQVINL